MEGYSCETEKVLEAGDREMDADTPSLDSVTLCWYSELEDRSDVSQSCNGNIWGHHKYQLE